MKKSVRLLAMLLCVLSIVALLPTTALAADVDEVAAVSAVIVVKANNAALCANKTDTLRCRPGEKVTLKMSKTVDLADEYGYYLATVKVQKTQWFVRKAGSSKWTQIKSRNNKFSYSFKYSKKLNGNRYRCKFFFTYRGSYYHAFTSAVCVKTKK